ncbi:MAG: hypothetical protein ACXW5W_22680 [Candidatus Binatia bacterium]
MKKVLVIDDHEPSRRQLIQSLHGCGYQIAAEGFQRQGGVGAGACFGC